MNLAANGQLQRCQIHLCELLSEPTNTRREESLPHLGGLKASHQPHLYFICVCQCVYMSVRASVRFIEHGGAGWVADASRCRAQHGEHAVGHG